MTFPITQPLQPEQEIVPIMDRKWLQARLPEILQDHQHNGIVIMEWFRDFSFSFFFHRYLYVILISQSRKVPKTLSKKIVGFQELKVDLKIMGTC